jgi:hypothetical protein
MIDAASTAPPSGAPKIAPIPEPMPSDTLRDRSGRSHESGRDSVLDQGGLLRRERFDSPGVRVWDGAVPTADTVHPVGERRSETVGLRICLCGKDIGGDHHVRLVENR